MPAELISAHFLGTARASPLGLTTATKWLAIPTTLLLPLSSHTHSAGPVRLGCNPLVLWPVRIPLTSSRLPLASTAVVRLPDSRLGRGLRQGVKLSCGQGAFPKGW